ncbi:LamG domain-containing protein, partial [bacterium]|nr:LamG domain-containing protein [bacterium]
AKVISLGDAGWISLQSSNKIYNTLENFSECMSCSIRDEELNLLVYLKLDEDRGFSVNDYSEFDNKGRLVGFYGDYWLTDDCMLNNCLAFGDQGHILDLGEIDLSQHNTFSFWAKADDREEKVGLFLFTNGSNNEGVFTDGINNDGFLWKISESIQASIPEAFIWDGNWHNYVFVRNEEKVKFYRNGAFVGASDFENYFSEEYKDVSKDQNLKEIGHSYCNGCGDDIYFKGIMDHIRVYDRILTADEISYGYNYPEKKFCSGCFNYLDEEGRANICYECSDCVFEKSIKYVEGVNVCDKCTECRRYGLIFDSNTANIKGFSWGGYLNDLLENIGTGWFQFSPNSVSGLYRSYLSAKYGSIYSRSDIGSSYSVVPPQGYSNATYIIQARGNVSNWVSEQMISVGPQGELIYDYNSPWMIKGGNYEFPSLENDYGNVLGSLDYSGLVSGNYGEIEKVLPGESSPSNPNVCLDGKIYFQENNTSIDIRSGSDAYIFKNATGETCDNGSGLIIIDGDLYINGNTSYDSLSVEGDSQKLASVAWIIKGDLHIDPNVTKLAGTFMILGDDEIENCGDDLSQPIEGCGIIYTGESNKQLEVSGQFLAKNFQFQRTFRSDFREAAELIIYDGRNIINTPLGLGDVLKSLPRWDQVAPY